jgi:hypothetical protein
MSFIHFFSNKDHYKNANYFSKTIIILIMDDNCRKNGENIKNFLNDYFIPEDKSTKNFLRSGYIMFGFSFEIIN